MWINEEKATKDEKTSTRGGDQRRKMRSSKVIKMRKSPMKVKGEAKRK